MPSLQSTSRMPKFINEFATFAQLEKHVATFDKRSFMVDNGALISEDNMFLLYRNFQVSCKERVNKGLGPLAEFEWTKTGFAHFTEYLKMFVFLTFDEQK